MHFLTWDLLAGSTHGMLVMKYKSERLLHEADLGAFILNFDLKVQTRNFRNICHNDLTNFRLCPALP
jgi:hypothetical protein